MQTQKLAALAAILFGAFAFAAPADAQVTLTLQTIDATGTNTSPGTAQTLDLSNATNGPLFGAALTAFNANNSDTVRQDATSCFTPGGQLVSGTDLQAQARQAPDVWARKTGSASSARHRREVTQSSPKLR